MRQYFFYSILFVGALVTGCEKNKNETAMLSESMQSRPAVAIIPLIDNSEHVLGWNLSDEITYSLCSKLDQKNTLNLTLPGKIKAAIKKIKGQNNPFGNEILWVKNSFDEDFVVFLEMIEHSEIPSEMGKKAPPETLSAQLNMSLRLRIIDIRGETPRIALQEILQESHFVPRQFTQYNFHQSLWNTEEFGLSPVGIAHAQLIKELKTRIEDYILLAKASK